MLFTHLKRLHLHHNLHSWTYGAEEDRVLNIPGERLKNVVSGRRFVGWYNGVPGDNTLDIDLDAEEAIILGQGNVAIDIARILLTPVDKLKCTDITSYSLEKLSQSKVRKVWLVGRRGPLQAAFTIAELREILKLDNCKTVWRRSDFIGIREITETLQRPRKRLTELMLKSSEEANSNVRHVKELYPIFLRGPVEFLGTQTVTGMKLSVNKLEGSTNHKVAVPTGSYEEISCGLAFRSIGYKSVQIDPSIPFDTQYGRIKNTEGRVNDNLYAAGWVATGPVGVILSTMTNAFHAGNLIAKEIANPLKQKAGSEGLQKILEHKGIQYVTYSDWKKIDKVECERGAKLGKPREKIVSITEMLNIAAN